MCKGTKKHLQESRVQPLLNSCLFGIFYKRERNRPVNQSTPAKIMLPHYPATTHSSISYIVSHMFLQAYSFIFPRQNFLLSIISLSWERTKYQLAKWLTSKQKERTEEKKERKKERKEKKMWKGRKINHWSTRDIRINFKLPGVNMKSEKAYQTFVFLLSVRDHHGPSPYWITTFT